MKTPRLSVLARTWCAVVFIVSLFIGLPPLTAAGATKLSLGIAQTQLIDDNGVRQDATLDRLVDAARDVFGQLYGSQVDLLAKGKFNTKIPAVTVKAIETEDSQIVSIELELGDKSWSKTILNSYKQLDAKSLANAFFFLINLSDGFSRFGGGIQPILIDRMDMSQVMPLDLAIYYSQPYSVAVKSNGNLLLGMYSIIPELDSSGKVVDFWGKTLVNEKNNSFAYDIKASPSGTVFSKSALNGEVYAFANTQDAPRKINTQIDQGMGFVVLDDGSFVIKETMGPRAVRFEGRKKSDVSLITNPQYPYVQIAAGPDSTIRVLDVYSGEIRTHDKNGTVIDRMVPLIASERISSIRQFVSCPDGSAIIVGMDFLARIDRNGAPIWFVDKATRPEMADNMMVASVAFDPTTASIYLVKSSSKAIIRILDRSWATEHKIDTQRFNPLIQANTALTRDPEDWDAILSKADWYEKAGATDLALASLVQLNAMEPSDRPIADRMNAIKIAKFLGTAEQTRSRVLDTIRTVGPESARADYQLVLRLFEQTLAIDPGNPQAIKSRNELINTMKKAEQAPTERVVPPLMIVQARINNLFPALSATYRTEPFGKVTVRNDGTSEVKAATLTVFIPRFMDFPTELPLPASLKPGQSLEVPVSALFNREALQITEDLPIQAQFSLKWDSGNQSHQKTVPTTLYRNTALTWENSGKLASFLTPNEDNVNSFALKSLDAAKGMVVEEAGLTSFNAKIWRAAVIANSLGSYGIAYLEDPQSPISKTLGKSEAIDTVRFPRTTLYYKSGDCDDSTALLGSLLEAAGIQTAIMTTPGHVFLAFDTGESADNAWIFGGVASGAVLIKNQTIWLPLETTVLKNGFRHAWQTAAKLVAQYQGSQDLEMLPVHIEWQEFPSIPLATSPYQIILPATQGLKTLVQTDSAVLTTNLYQQSVSNAQSQLPANGKQRISQLNRIGILHARFGKADMAIPLFLQALKEDKQHLAAYLNLGSIYLQTGHLPDSISILLQAKAIRPESTSVQVMLAQTYYSMGDQTKTQEAYLALSKQSKDLADQYSWLTKTGGVTADNGQKTGVERAANAASPVKAMWSDGEQ